MADGDQHDEAARSERELKEIGQVSGGAWYDRAVVKWAGILALVGSLANLVFGCAVFQEGFAGAMWCFFETPLREEPNPLIPLLYEIGASACGITGGIVLLAARGPAVIAACPILVVAGLALFIPRGVYSLSLFGPIADDYARYGLFLILSGLISTTLPGLVAGVTIARRYISIRRRRAATARRQRSRGRRRNTARVA